MKAMMMIPEAYAARLETLPTMPEPAQRVLAMLKDPTTTAQDLQNVIEHDQSLAASVLRLANSSLFAPRQRVANLSLAIMRIGFFRLRSLVLTTVVSGLRSLVPGKATAQRNQLWQHSVRAALAARTLAECLGLEWSEEAFVFGLLHDCGRQVLLALETDDYIALMSESENDLPLPERERIMLGVTHEEIGAALMKQWNMPRALIVTCGSHHGDQQFEGPDSAVVALIALADRIVSPENGESIEPAAAALGIEPDQVEPLVEAVQRTIHEHGDDLMAL
ncbi:MAG: hypothetical protein Kow0062_00940 [Acidobacteriota bacterium]|nr:MAG: HDOD domain-containing protein [Acidobacteriota bacterium]